MFKKVSYLIATFLIVLLSLSSVISYAEDKTVNEELKEVLLSNYPDGYFDEDGNFYAEVETGILKFSENGMYCDNLTTGEYIHMHVYDGACVNSVNAVSPTFTFDYFYTDSATSWQGQPGCFFSMPSSTGAVECYGTVYNAQGIAQTGYTSYADTYYGAFIKYTSPLTTMTFYGPGAYMSGYNTGGSTGYMGLYFKYDSGNAWYGGASMRGYGEVYCY